jgi:hypothetical protein
MIFTGKAAYFTKWHTALYRQIHLSRQQSLLLLLLLPMLCAL